MELEWILVGLYEDKPDSELTLGGCRICTWWLMFVEPIKPLCVIQALKDFECQRTIYDEFNVVILVNSILGKYFLQYYYLT